MGQPSHRTFNIYFKSKPFVLAVPTEARESEEYQLLLLGHQSTLRLSTPTSQAWQASWDNLRIVLLIFILNQNLLCWPRQPKLVRAKVGVPNGIRTHEAGHQEEHERRAEVEQPDRLVVGRRDDRDDLAAGRGVDPSRLDRGARRTRQERHFSVPSEVLKSYSFRSYSGIVGMAPRSWPTIAASGSALSLAR